VSKSLLSYTLTLACASVSSISLSTCPSLKESKLAWLPDLTFLVSMNATKEPSAIYTTSFFTVADLCRDLLTLLLDIFDSALGLDLPLGF